MTDPTPYPATPAAAGPADPAARPGADVVWAIALAVALVVGGAVFLATRGSDDTTLTGASPTAEPFASDQPVEQPTEAPPGEPTSEPTSEPSAAAPSATAPAATGAPAAGSCSYVEEGEASRDVGTPPAAPLDVANRTATIETSVGRIVLRLSPSAPCTTSSFAFLAGEEYFDDTPCHRLTTQGIFVLQCGDPTGRGNGGPGYSFDDEALEGARYPKGTVAMANAGPGTNGSQFFLVYDDTQLPPSYTPWARVTQGLDVLEKVAAAGSTPEGDGAPNTKVQIESIRIS